MDPLTGMDLDSAVRTDASSQDPVAAAPEVVAPPSVGPSPAAFMERAGAAMLDCGIQALLCLFVVILTGVTAAFLGLGKRLELDSVYGRGMLLLALLLYSLTEVFGTATPGKSFPQLSVARPDGRPAPGMLRLRRWAFRNAHLLLFTACYALWTFEVLAMTGTSAGAPFVRAVRVLFGGGALLAGVVIALGSLMALAPGRRTLHDYLSGTAVYPAKHVAAAAAEMERGFEPLMRHDPPANYPR
jgi:uncharacterized RDD family membrane protein YckC